FPTRRSSDLDEPGRADLVLDLAVLAQRLRQPEQALEPVRVLLGDDERPDAGAALDQALGAQQVERLPDRVAGRAELPDEGGLGRQLAAAELPVPHLAAQDVR